MASKRLIRRVVLERASRPLLARFLSTHAAAFFEAHGLSLAALAASPTRERALVHRVFDLIHDRSLTPALPPAFRSLLATLDALATPAGGEAILRADDKALIPRATYGDEDLALVLLLDHPALAVEARREADADEVQSFTEYEPETPRPLRVGEDELAALKRLLGAKLEERDRTRRCEVHARREGDVVSLEIVHGRRPKTFDKVDAKTLELDQSTDIHTERAFVEVNVAAGTIAVHAARGIKEILRDVLGEVFASSPTHFRPARSYDLSPFALLPAALSTAGASPRLRRVELHGIHVLTRNGGTLVSFVRSRKDLLLDEEAKESLDAALRAGTPVAVKLYLFIDGRPRGVCVEMSTKGGKNLVDFDRSDPEVVEVVRGYLRARGVLREPGDEARVEAANPDGANGPAHGFATDAVETVS
jgi:hypothetical protein